MNVVINSEPVAEKSLEKWFPETGTDFCPGLDGERLFLRFLRTVQFFKTAFLTGAYQLNRNRFREPPIITIFKVP